MVCMEYRIILKSQEREGVEQAEEEPGSKQSMASRARGRNKLAWRDGALQANIVFVNCKVVVHIVLLIVCLVSTPSVGHGYAGSPVNSGSSGNRALLESAYLSRNEGGDAVVASPSFQAHTVSELHWLQNGVVVALLNNGELWRSPDEGDSWIPDSGKHMGFNGECEPPAFFRNRIEKVEEFGNASGIIAFGTMNCLWAAHDKDLTSETPQYKPPCRVANDGDTECIAQLTDNSHLPLQIQPHPHDPNLLLGRAYQEEVSILPTPLESGHCCIAFHQGYLT